MGADCATGCPRNAAARSLAGRCAGAEHGASATPPGARHGSLQDTWCLQLVGIDDDRHEEGVRVLRQAVRLDDRGDADAGRSGGCAAVPRDQGARGGRRHRRPDGLPAAGHAARLGIYVTVDNVDETVAQAKAMGGKVLMEIMEVPTVGRMATLQDPQGAVINVITYAEMPDEKK
ncbi:VOC family protein [Roseateles noduli]|uniref:VOC family protein n=1 Tax=Roseateles noduli TaxID=2052484 RepID=UPI003D646A04